jgi:hypothetical protein
MSDEKRFICYIAFTEYYLYNKICYGDRKIGKKVSIFPVFAHKKYPYEKNSCPDVDFYKKHYLSNYFFNIDNFVGYRQP